MLLDDARMQCFGLRSRMAARAVSRVYNDRLRPLGLQTTQFALLVAIEKSGDAPVAALAEHLDTEPSALLRNLKVLETRGLVAGEGGRGRRGRRLHLTQAGATLVTQAQPIWVKAQADMTGAIGEDAAAVRAALGRIEAAALKLEAGQ
jgi:DNA-binding MarR family transcriptional regulator